MLEIGFDGARNDWYVIVDDNPPYTDFASEQEAVSWWFADKALSGCPVAWCSGPMADTSEYVTLCAQCARNAWMTRTSERRAKIESGALARTLIQGEENSVYCDSCGETIREGDTDAITAMIDAALASLQAIEESPFFFEMSMTAIDAATTWLAQTRVAVTGD